MRAIATAEPVVLPQQRAAERDSDVDLVDRVRAGDDRAFECLYERYHRRIAAYIYGMVQDYGRAEDIAQDVFMSALRRMRETDRPIAFKPWVYEIAKNACIDQFRRARRTEEVSYDAEEGLGASDYGRLGTGATHPTAPDAAVERKMTLDHLRGAFSGLSETHHEILVMRELEGLSYREIGERLGMSRPSVESTLFRARRRLSEEYEELISGERCLRVQAIIVTAGQGGLGARDQRRLAAHVSHCQGCRRHARIAGVDDALLARPVLRAKIAALLPLPAFLRKRWEGGGEAAGSASGIGTTWVAYSSQAANYVEPAMGWAKAAAVAATVAVAGVSATQVAPQRGLGLPEEGGAPVAADAPRVEARGGSSTPRTSEGRAATSVPSSSSSSSSAGSSRARPARTTTSASRPAASPSTASQPAPRSPASAVGVDVADVLRPAQNAPSATTGPSSTGGGDSAVKAEPAGDNLPPVVPPAAPNGSTSTGIAEAVAADGPVAGTVGDVESAVGGR